MMKAGVMAWEEGRIYRGRRACSGPMIAMLTTRFSDDELHIMHCIAYTSILVEVRGRGDAR